MGIAAPMHDCVTPAHPRPPAHRPLFAGSHPPGTVKLFLGSLSQHLGSVSDGEVCVRVDCSGGVVTRCWLWVGPRHQQTKHEGAEPFGAIPQTCESAGGFKPSNPRYQPLRYQTLLRAVMSNQTNLTKLKQPLSDWTGLTSSVHTPVNAHRRSSQLETWFTPTSVVCDRPGKSLHTFWCCVSQEQLWVTARNEAWHLCAACVAGGWTTGVAHSAVCWFGVTPQVIARFGYMETVDMGAQFVSVMVSM